MSEIHPTAARTALLRSLAAEFLPAGTGRSLIAVDGVDGSGKSTFADDLAAVIRGRPVIVIRVDDFLNLRDVRHQRGLIPRKDSGSIPMTTGRCSVMSSFRWDREGTGATGRLPPTTGRMSG